MLGIIRCFADGENICGRSEKLAIGEGVEIDLRIRRMKDVYSGIRESDLSRSLESVFVIVERRVISIRGRGRSYFPLFSYNGGKAREESSFPKILAPVESPIKIARRIIPFISQRNPLIVNREETSRLHSENRRSAVACTSKVSNRGKGRKNVCSHSTPLRATFSWKLRGKYRHPLRIAVPTEISVTTLLCC